MAGALLGPALLAGRARALARLRQDKVAEGFGATGVRLDDKRTLVEGMREALATPGPVVADVVVTEEENVYPMIAPGAAARDMEG